MFIKIKNLIKTIYLRFRSLVLPKRSSDVIKDYFFILSLRPQFIKLKWEPIQDCKISRVEPGCVQIENKLYLFAGYHTLDHVISAIDILDLQTGQWIDHIEIPTFIAQTHQGVVCEDDRHIYYVAGQVGIQCSPCVNDCYVYDVVKNEWHTLPSLPKARYAPATRLLEGRLHVFSGSTEDRVTPAKEHWSIAVEGEKALENQWREEEPIPRGGPHRVSAVVDSRLFAIGGQEGDRPPIPGDLRYTCDWTAPKETFYGDSFVYDAKKKNWRRISDMPVKATHAEYSTVVLDHKIVILGGLTENKMMTNVIQVYDTVRDKWSIVGRIPWRNKGLAAGYCDGWLYALVGQKEISTVDPGFGDVLKEGFRTRFFLEG